MKLQKSVFSAMLLGVGLIGSGCAIDLRSDRGSFVTMTPISDQANGCDGLLDGATVSGYLHEFVEPGTNCMHATKTCIDGQWVGPTVFMTCSVRR